MPARRPPEPSGLPPAGRASQAPRRRQRSTTPYAITVRVDLVGAQPAVWRQLELASTLRLDQLHGVLQAVFDWDDSHLHRFTLGETAWDDAAEHYLCPDDVEEGGDRGARTSDVRLDEVLSAPGDRLLYTYDYGDEWNHAIVVEAVAEPVEQVRLTGGGGAAPPEDSGGVWDWDAGAAPFDLDAARAALAAWQQERSVPPEIATLLQQVAHSPAEQVVRDLLALAELDRPVQVDEATAKDMLRRYAWLLDRVGNGLPLTSAGWLPPAVVTETMDAAYPDHPWIGKRSREDLTEPVRRLRASAQRLGLLRAARGRLTVTKAGAALRADPVRLWWHVAERLASPPRDPFARAAGALVLLATAAGRLEPDRLAEVLTAAGWSSGQGQEVSGYALVHAAAAVGDVLRAMGAANQDDDASVSQGGRALARAALRKDDVTAAGSTAGATGAAAGRGLIDAGQWPW